MKCFPALFLLAALLSSTFATPASAAASAKATEAEQLRIIQIMSGELRARLDRLPVLLPADHPADQSVTVPVVLNRNPVVVEGQRFDGVVVVAPKTKASFAWAFAAPDNLATWYILRERGDMKGFADFLRRTRDKLPGSEKMQPEANATVTLQRLDSAAWSPGERYVIWFRFEDDQPAELTLRAGFFAKTSLNNNQLPALLFPK